MRNATDITVILDRSGSMSTIRQDMEGGFDTFINKQREIKTDDISVSLVKFDDYVENAYQGLHINYVPKLDLQPRGSTALYDAVGRTINSIGERLSRLPEYSRPSKVIVLIITDGYENASREFSASQVKDMIRHQTEKYNWTFVFLGANLNAVEVARNIGIAPSMSMTYAANNLGTSSAFDSLCSNVTSYRAVAGSSANAARTMSFCASQRDEQTTAGVDPSQNAVDPAVQALIDAAKLKAEQDAKLVTTPV